MLFHLTHKDHAASTKEHPLFGWKFLVNFLKETSVTLQTQSVTSAETNAWKINFIPMCQRQVPPKTFAPFLFSRRQETLCIN